MIRERVIGVIDDDDSVRGALRRLLRTAGFRVSQFATAEEYLAQLDHQSVDCLLIDVGLPRMDGLELLERLRGPHFRPALVITAREDEHTRSRALAAGAFGFFRKPCDNRRLLNAINQVLDLYQRESNLNESDPESRE